MSNRSFELAPGRIAHASGCVWLPEERAALIADVHLGYGWAQRRRGQLGPVSDGGARDKLAALMSELEPKTVVFLGDIVHAPRPAILERELVEQTLRIVNEKAQIVFIRGNHDRGFASDYPQFAVQLCEHWSCAGIVAIHGDKPTPEQTTKHILLGHLHPAVSVHDDAGASQRIPVFLSGTKGTVLPAFSPFAAGYAVNKGLPRDLKELLGSNICLLAATGTRVVKLGPLAALRARMSQK